MTEDRALTTPDSLAELTAIGNAKQWVWATQMEIERFLQVFIRWAAGDKGRPPLAWEDQRASANTFSEAQFLLNAAGQAMKALGRAAIAIGPEGEKVRLLRNVHEHWEAHREAFASKSRPKQRSGAKFEEMFPDTLPWVFKYDATGTWISALQLEAFWEELLTAETELFQRDVALHDHLGIDRQEEPPDLARPLPLPEDKGKLLAIAVLAQDLVIEAPPPPHASME
jgi:hypothetical protein